MPLEKWADLLGAGVDISGDLTSGVVRGISIDSRTLKPGEAFFAIKGERFDGHDFVHEAVHKGAKVVVADPDRISDKDETAVFILSRDPLQVLQVMAGHYRRLFEIPVIGLTGTNGKTTTKEMIADVLAQKYDVCRTSGNLNNHIGLPLSLMEFEAATQIAIMEMGMNQPGEIALLCQISQPNYGLVTNIGPGHIGNFSGMEAIAHEKTALFRALEADNLAFINLDDPYLSEAREDLPAKTLTYGLSADADVFAERRESDAKGCVKIRLQGQTDVQLAVPGDYQIQNALAAAAVGVHFEIPMAEIKSALEAFQGVANRMELLPFGDALIVLDVYNANPDSLNASLQTAAAMTRRRGGKMHVVLGDMLELGRESRKYHEEAGRLAVASGVSRLYLFGPESEWTERAFRDNGGDWASHFDDKSRLARALADAIGPQDVILIKGSRGMQMETVMQQLTDSNRTGPRS